MQKIKFALVFFANIILISCGFHLRGLYTNMPSWIKTASVLDTQDLAQGRVKKLLIEQLENAHIELVEPNSTHNLLILLQKEDFSREPVGISSGTATRQYSLTYKLSFQIIVNKTKNNNIVDDNIIVTRQVTMNHDRILGSEDEETQTIRDIRQDAVMQILYKIQHI